MFSVSAISDTHGNALFTDPSSFPHWRGLCAVPMHYFESHYTEVGHSNLYLSKGDARLSSSHLQDLESREGFRPAMHALLDVVGCVSAIPRPSPVFLLLHTWSMKISLAPGWSVGLHTVCSASLSNPPCISEYFCKAKMGKPVDLYTILANPYVLRQNAILLA